MRKRGYKNDIAIGYITAGGSLGILIPPGVLMIILALTAKLSVGQLFIAGILPGMLLSGLFVGYILICRYPKGFGPAVPPTVAFPPPNVSGCCTPCCCRWSDFRGDGLDVLWACHTQRGLGDRRPRRDDQTNL